MFGEAVLDWFSDKNEWRKMSSVSRTKERPSLIGYFLFADKMDYPLAFALFFPH